MTSQLVARSLLHDWQVAPAEYELANYDENKIEYRQYVQDFITALPKKSLKKKLFYTISTNVLCADIHTSKDTIDPVDRDIYLPLEIAITKWSLASGKEPTNERALDTRVWMLNPGPPPSGCRCFALDHIKNHKIEFDDWDKGQNTHIESDVNLIMREINSFLSADRTVFSTSLRNARQDLGSLKWLNQQTDKKSKPIRVYSLEDLYVVLARHFEPAVDPFVGQGIANFRLSCIENYDPVYHCKYHQTRAKLDDGTTGNCARALAYLTSNKLIEDVFGYTKLVAT